MENGTTPKTNLVKLNQELINIAFRALTQAISVVQAHKALLAEIDELKVLRMNKEQQSRILPLLENIDITEKTWNTTLEAIEAMTDPEAAQRRKEKKENNNINSKPNEKVDAFINSLKLNN